jgi:hypothetical protein
MKSISAVLMALIGACLYMGNGHVGGPEQARMGSALLGICVIVCSLIAWMIVMLRRP